MRNLLNFFLKYNYWFLFILLEGISFALLFRFNNYQAGAFFTSSNRLVGSVYEMTNQVAGYFHLKAINDELVQRNVHLEMQVESLRKTLTDLAIDSISIERIKEKSL